MPVSNQYQKCTNHREKKEEWTKCKFIGELSRRPSGPVCAVAALNILLLKIVFFVLIYREIIDDLQ